MQELYGKYKNHDHPNIFSFETTDKRVIEIRDFQATGAVTHARGYPFYFSDLQFEI